jgi:cytochrome c553
MLAFALILGGCDQPSPTGSAAEEMAYRSCTACHGATGLGNRGMQAPALVNLDDWYIARQLKNYKAGVRGKHSRDTYGMQMASQASLLSDDRAIDAVIRRINSFPDKSPLATIQADLDSGRDKYDIHCSSCHGPAGVGNVEMNAPSLRGIDDWYLVRQYENFRAGIRGAHEDDLYGQQMRPMAQLLSEQEMKDVAAWLLSLGIVE